MRPLLGMCYGDFAQHILIRRRILLQIFLLILGRPIGRGAQVSGNQQERKYRRFHLECPVRVKFQDANSAAEVETISQNVSICGVLVKSAAMIPEHTRVTFIISLQGELAGHPIYLAGEGEIVRVESSGASFAVAIKCEVPLTQLEHRLAEV